MQQICASVITDECTSWQLACIACFSILKTGCISQTLNGISVSPCGLHREFKQFIENSSNFALHLYIKCAVDDEKSKDSC